MQRIIGYKNYITKDGDTFDFLALSMYGEEKLSHDIIKFNPDYSDFIIFPDGIKLRIPIIENQNTPQFLPPWRR